MNKENIKIELTGNPFVDTGIGVIASLAGLDVIGDLTLAKVKSVYGDGSQLADWNSKLKVSTQVLTTNNVLFQPSYRLKKGKDPYSINKSIYKSTLKGLLSEIGKERSGPRCWACGASSSFDFANICRKAIEDSGKKAPEGKWVGRDWFPLAGSLGSDAQALPAASDPPHICPKCLFAVNYLPLGLMLIQGRPTVFQCTSTEFWYELIRSIVDEVKGRVQSGNFETLGKKEGNGAALHRFLILFERLQRRYDNVPEVIALYMWHFSNSGNSPECQIREVPNAAIKFLWDATQKGLGHDFESLISTEGRNPRYSLYECLLNGSDYRGLYPEGSRKGASPELFDLYQILIRNHSGRTLLMARKLAGEISKNASPKELDRIRRVESFREVSIRNRFRGSMVRMVENGDFTLDDYLDLFPPKGDQGIAVEWDGWNLIRFYLHHTNEPLKVKQQYNSKPRPYGRLHYYAGQFYNSYVSEKGRTRFQKDILSRIDRGIDISWIRNQFVRHAEFVDGFTYGHWLKLCQLEDGRLSVSELLYQMRLLWSQWIYQEKTMAEIPIIQDGEAIDGLSERLSILLESIFLDYIYKRGLDRFHQDILLRLRRKEIGLTWFQNKLTGNEFPDGSLPLPIEEWDAFLTDDGAEVSSAEKLFQLHLALANLYRIKRSA